MIAAGLQGAFGEKNRPHTVAQREWPKGVGNAFRPVRVLWQVTAQANDRLGSQQVADHKETDLEQPKHDAETQDPQGFLMPPLISL